MYFCENKESALRWIVINIYIYIYMSVTGNDYGMLIVFDFYIRHVKIDTEEISNANNMSYIKVKYDKHSVIITSYAQIYNNSSECTHRNMS